MAAVNSRKHVLTVLAALVLMLAAAFYALAQQSGDTKKSSTAPAAGKRHALAATLDTVQWGSIPRSRRSSPSTRATSSRSRR
jgi:hypothetical protein